MDRAKKAGMIGMGGAVLWVLMIVMEYVSGKLDQFWWNVSGVRYFIGCVKVLYVRTNQYSFITGHMLNIIISTLKGFWMPLSDFGRS